jgi:hypothetical protein
MFRCAILAGAAVAALAAISPALAQSETDQFAYAPSFDMPQPADGFCAPSLVGAVDAEVLTLPDNGAPMKVRLTAIVEHLSPGPAGGSIELVRVGILGPDQSLATAALPADGQATLTADIDWLPGTDSVTDYEVRLVDDGVQAVSTAAGCEPQQAVTAITAEQIWGAVLQRI